MSPVPACVAVPVVALTIVIPLLLCASMPSVPLVVSGATRVDTIVPSLKMAPLTPGRTASASDASISPVARLRTTLLPVVIALKSMACAPPCDAFIEFSVPGVDQHHIAVRLVHLDHVVVRGRDRRAGIVRDGQGEAARVVAYGAVAAGLFDRAAVRDRRVAGHGDRDAARGIDDERAAGLHRSGLARGQCLHRVRRLPVGNGRTMPARGAGAPFAQACCSSNRARTARAMTSFFIRSTCKVVGKSGIV